MAKTETVTPGDKLEKLACTDLVKPLLGWKLAVCQHPMYLLIDEDRGEPTVGERVLPWGAPDAATYVERVVRNLDSLDRFDDLYLNYEFSGVELEAMARTFPETTRRMREQFEKGRLDFVGGTFSQPHSQVISAESNWRQFERGMAVHEDLFGKRVKVHFLQETGVHQQMPQLLKAFGFEIMVVSPFPWAMEVFEGKFEVSGLFRGVDTLAGDEFVEAVALDGTPLPLYLKVIDSEHERADSIRAEISKGLPRGPVVWTLFPDLIEVEKAFYDSKKRLFDFVLLEEALRERLKKAPPRAKARIYTYWSYTEGVWAEELLRANQSGEVNAVLAGAMLAMLAGSGRSNDRLDLSLDGVWHDILKYQHHDVAWIEVTDLRRTAVKRLEAGVAECRSIMASAAAELTVRDGGSCTVFTGVPYKGRSLLEQPCNSMLPGEGPFQRIGSKDVGWVNHMGGGATSFPIAAAPAVAVAPSSLPPAIQTAHYEVRFAECGLMQEIRVAGGAKAVLTGGEFLGGEIRAMIDDKWFDNRGATAQFFDGPVAQVVERVSRMDRIGLSERYMFMREEPLIRVELELEFDGNEVGYFWMDETKLSMYLPTGAGELYHDIPFGYVSARPDRTLFASNWVYSAGLVLVNKGTPKHYLRDGVLACPIAWGGNSFTNRLQFGWASKNEYDLRLYGRHTIRYDIILAGAFDGPAIARQVASLNAASFVAPGRVEKPLSGAANPGLLFTALYAKDGRAWARGYKLPGGNCGSLRDWEIFNLPLEQLP